MSKLRQDEEMIYQGIKGWQKKLSALGVGIPTACYLTYRDLFRRYKEAGETQASMMAFLLELAEKPPDLEDFIYEIADLVSGYFGNREFRVWQHYELDALETSPENADSAQASSTDN